MHRAVLRFDVAISTHTSLTGRDEILKFFEKTGKISTHTSLAGRDFDKPSIYSSFSPFLLTRPSRDVTNSTWTSPTWDGISTHTSLAGRDIILK